jgi:hypothetical protein
MHMPMADELTEGLCPCQICGAATPVDELCETDNVWLCGTCYGESPEGQAEWEEVCESSDLSLHNIEPDEEDLW